jgi:hypothetical protein
VPNDAIPEDGGELGKQPEILRCLADDLELAGLAGEKRTAQIIYLAATSRLFSQPLQVAVKGPSSGGKRIKTFHWAYRAGRSRPRLSRQSGDPPRSAGADSPRRSDAGNAQAGHVTETGRARAAGRIASRHGLALLSPPPLSGADYPARDLALPSLHPELPRRGDMLAERGLDLSYETVRRWVLKFGPMITRRLRRRRPRPSDPWHLDERWSGSPAGGCISGGRSITKARCSTCWSSADASGSCNPSNQPDPLSAF